MNDSFSRPAIISIGKSMIAQTPNPHDSIAESQSVVESQEVREDDQINALSGNRVGVEIEPETKGNRVNVQMCSCSFIFNCLSGKKRDD